MTYCEDQHIVLDAQLHEEGLIGAGELAKLWQPWGDKSAIDSSTVVAHDDSSFSRCVLERGYDAMLTSL